MKALNDGLGYGAGSGGTVTQGTSITTGVTLDKLNGTITTVSQTIAAGATGTFTVTNSFVDATDAVAVNLKAPPLLVVLGIVIALLLLPGSFDLTIRNDSGATAGNNTLVITFLVLKGAAA